MPAELEQILPPKYQSMVQGFRDSTCSMPTLADLVVIRCVGCNTVDPSLPRVLVLEIGDAASPELPRANEQEMGEFDAMLTVEELDRGLYNRFYTFFQQSFHAFSCPYKAGLHSIPLAGLRLVARVLWRAQYVLLKPSLRHLLNAMRSAPHRDLAARLALLQGMGNTRFSFVSTVSVLWPHSFSNSSLAHPALSALPRSYPVSFMAGNPTDQKDRAELAKNALNAQEAQSVEFIRSLRDELATASSPWCAGRLYQGMTCNTDEAQRQREDIDIIIVALLQDQQTPFCPCCYRNMSDKGPDDGLVAAAWINSEAKICSSHIVSRFYQTEVSGAFQLVYDSRRKKGQISQASGVLPGDECRVRLQCTTCDNAQGSSKAKGWEPLLKADSLFGCLKQLNNFQEPVVSMTDLPVESQRNLFRFLVPNLFRILFLDLGQSKSEENRIHQRFTDRLRLYLHLHLLKFREQSSSSSSSSASSSSSSSSSSLDEFSVYVFPLSVSCFYQSIATMDHDNDESFLKRCSSVALGTCALTRDSRVLVLLCPLVVILTETSHADWASFQVSDVPAPTRLSMGSIPLSAAEDIGSLYMRLVHCAPTPEEQKVIAAKIKQKQPDGEYKLDDAQKLAILRAMKGNENC